MARYHYWQYIVDEEGSPLDNVEISFYLSDQPLVFANIFLNPTTGAISTTDTVGLTTDANGFFEFWVGDQWESGGYDHLQKFKLKWFKASIIAGQIDPVDIFPPLPPVDETITGQEEGEKNKKNKLISNALAYKWNNHIDIPIPSASPHDIYPVELCNTNNVFNKVVSNKLINQMYTGALGASAVSLDATVADMFSVRVAGAQLISSNISAGDPGDPDNYILTNPSAGGIKNIRHNLLNQWPIVQLMKVSDKTVVIPSSVKSISDRRTVIEVAELTDYKITIIG